MEDGEYPNHVIIHFAYLRAWSIAFYYRHLETLSCIVLHLDVYLFSLKNMHPIYLPFQHVHRNYDISSTLVQRLTHPSAPSCRNILTKRRYTSPLQPTNSPSFHASCFTLRLAATCLTSSPTRMYGGKQGVSRLHGDLCFGLAGLWGRKRLIG